MLELIAKDPQAFIFNQGWACVFCDGGAASPQAAWAFVTELRPAGLSSADRQSGGRLPKTGTSMSDMGQVI
jgi:hypothetical protein